MKPPDVPVVLDATARREGFLVGAAVGAALVAPPAGQRHAAVALADGLLVELTGGGVDLRRLAGRWLDWQREQDTGDDPLLTSALDHLREFDAPAAVLPSGSMVAVAAALPAALASASPRAMIAGSFHVARMLDPDEATALAAMAMVIAASAFLDGRRDFVPDVVAALRANDAGAGLLEAIRTIPRDPRAAPPVPVGRNPDPASAVTWLLWQAHHRPRGLDAMNDLSTQAGIAPAIGAIAGALFGARDGLANWPQAWFDRGGEDVVLRRALTRRLGGLSS